MKPILLLLSIFSTIFLLAQNKAEKASTVSIDYLRDSVKIENEVSFYTYTNRQLESCDAVKFTVKITNLGSQPIPNLIRVSNRSKYLKLLYNGEDSNNLSLYNGTEATDWPWFIEAGDDDEFSASYVLFPDSGILLYSQPLNITWQYMGIFSSTEMVDLVNKRIY
ncbi:hypothetical protein [Parvicella tangerina]|uniref:DUF4352 domain-containing protein n=1 Tax=Parvicella tangerina TaxID=2829795 RepID=A0A916JN46_9FLAO|nr:hypothetical protein [Parvicella tangerina]CAG5080360.1 hypothetical protein CRYO30217_01273 [Parvicella tangerina]